MLYNFFRFMCITFLLFSATLFSATTTTRQPYHLPGIAVSLPNDIRLVVNNFLTGIKDCVAPTASCLRCLLLYGRYGVDKRDIAKAIAAIAGSEFMELNLSNTDPEYPGSGVARVDEMFKSIKQKFFEGKQSIVLFVNNVDRLCVDELEEYRVRLALRYLYSMIADHYESEHRLLVIGGAYGLKDVDGKILNIATKIKGEFLPA